jgi:hypothetical protein
VHDVRRDLVPKRTRHEHVPTEPTPPIGRGGGASDGREQARDQSGSLSSQLVVAAGGQGNGRDTLSGTNLKSVSLTYDVTVVTLLRIVH